ncbi:MAG: peptidoglycan DD-metalloendopeptidase family protein [Dehalococcoidia bacterium]|nr:peptidoglycan DD-metalloendopeptidase family protein [Dehalococcoidia bacterium]
MGCNERVKQLSRRELLAMIGGLGAAGVVSGIGWVLASNGDEGRDNGLALDEGQPSNGGAGAPEDGATIEERPNNTSTPVVGTPVEDAEATAGETAEPSATAEPTDTATPEPTQQANPDEPVGYAWPMEGVHMPIPASQLPNAARDYRCGYHEGLDFYPYDSGPFFARGAAALAPRPGTVVRADHDFVEYTTADREAALAMTCAADGADSVILDRLRGRQVWVEHDDGNTTRYCHLDDRGPIDVSVGQSVAAGARLAGVGNSGTSNGAAGTENDIHLHFEMRLGGQDGPYLGSGQPEDEVRRLYENLFGV